MTSRRRMMAVAMSFEPDTPIPAEWEAEETIHESWAEIIYHVNKGDYKNRYRLGDRKVANFGDEGLCVMQLAAFDEDTKADGSGKAAITWVGNNVLKTALKTTDTCYYYSSFRTKVNSYIAKLPQVLQSAIVPVTKEQYDLTRSNGVNKTTETIWVPVNEELSEGEPYRVSFSQNHLVYRHLERIVHANTNGPYTVFSGSALTRGCNTYYDFDIITRYSFGSKGQKDGIPSDLFYVLPCFCL